MVADYVHFGIGTARTRSACGTPPVAALGQEIDIFGEYSALAPELRTLFILGAVLVARKAGYRDILYGYAEIFG